MTRRRPAEGPPPVHSDAFHGAITRELVRLTLGGRGDRRPELLVGIAPAMRRFTKATQTAALALADLQQRYLERVCESRARTDKGKTT